MSDLTYEGLAGVFRAGAAKSRQWPYNADAQVQADVYDAMADEAKRQAETLKVRLGYRIGYLCVQGYPSRICSGCTSVCDEPVYTEGEADQ